MDYDKMNLHELFAALREATIAEFEAEGEEQHAAADVEGVIVREIRTRKGTEPYYRAMLDDEHPRIRHRGALGIKKTDPATAMRVFQELDKNAPGRVAIPALHEVMALEKKGFR